MKDYLVYRTIKSEKYRFFSCCIPKDLQSYFNNRSKFYLSINSVTNRQARLLCQSLNRITIELFAEIRAGMKSLTIEDIKKILRVEIRKQILWAHHVDEGTSEHDLQQKIKGLSTMSEQENSLLMKIAEEDPRLHRDRVRVPRRDSYEKRPVLSATIHPDIKRTLVSMSKRTGMTVSQVADEVLYTGLIEMQELDAPG